MAGDREGAQSCWREEQGAKGRQGKKLGTRGDKYVKMKRTIIYLIITLLLQGCRPAAQYAELNGLTQGTTYHIVVEASPALDVADLRMKVESLLSAVDNSLSIYNDSICYIPY